MTTATLNPMAALARSEGHKPTRWRGKGGRAALVTRGHLTPQRLAALRLIGKGMSFADYDRAMGGSPSTNKSIIQICRRAELIEPRDGIWVLTDLGRTRMKEAQ